jgi:hypothetical protein
MLALERARGSPRGLTQRHRRAPFVLVVLFDEARLVLDLLVAGRQERQQRLLGEEARALQAQLESAERERLQQREQLALLEQQERALRGQLAAAAERADRASQDLAGAAQRGGQLDAELRQSQEVVYALQEELGRTARERPRGGAFICCSSSCLCAVSAALCHGRHEHWRACAAHQAAEGLQHTRQRIFLSAILALQVKVPQPATQPLDLILSSLVRYSRYTAVRA